jgi:hypothetical protein
MDSCSEYTTDSDTPAEKEVEQDLIPGTKQQTATGKQTQAEYKAYIVYSSQLDQLFKQCTECKADITALTKYTAGTMLTVISKCPHGHTSKWTSQPLLRKMPLGNLEISAAVLFAGSTHGKMASILGLLKVPFVSRVTFASIQKTYLAPVVDEAWQQHQTAVLSVLAETPLRLCGDARCDSPGYSAKYSSYSVMDMQSGLIVDQQLVQVTEAGSSVGMETVGLERCLDFLQSYGIEVGLLATDRHLGIQALLKRSYPAIEHQFDVWHVAKNVGKRLRQKASKRDAEELMPWIKSITNHLYWAAQTCDEDPELLKEKWASCCNHIANRHEWNGSKMTQCAHGPIGDDDDTAWLELDSPAHKALKAVALDKRLLKDISGLSKFCHTGSLENYHSMLLKYAPKRQHFTYQGMSTRLQMAALDHNNNIGRSLAIKQSGSPIVTQVFNKARKEWVLRNKYVAKKYTYLDELMQKVVERRMDRSVKMRDPASRTQLKPLPPNIASKPKPSKQEALQLRQSRFKNHES